MDEPVDNVNAEPLQQEGAVNRNINENGNDVNNNENGIANIDNIEEEEEVEEEEEDDGNANPNNAAAADEENENGNDANEGENGVIDGGVAGESGEDGRSTSCDLVSFSLPSLSDFFGLHIVTTLCRSEGFVACTKNP